LPTILSHPPKNFSRKLWTTFSARISREPSPSPALLQTCARPLTLTSSSAASYSNQTPPVPRPLSRPRSASPPATTKPLAFCKTSSRGIPRPSDSLPICSPFFGQPCSGKTKLPSTTHRFGSRQRQL
jgi:hypothetical protein